MNEAERRLHRDRVRKWRAANPEKAREVSRRANRKYYQKHKVKKNAQSKGRDPVKKRATELLNMAVVRGDLVRPDICSACGGRPKGTRICGHHPDYSKPLEVVWLCDRCHAKHHRGEPLTVYPGSGISGTDIRVGKERGVAEKVLLSMKGELKRRVDEARGSESRSAWVSVACEEKLARGTNAGLFPQEGGDDEGAAAVAGRGGGPESEGDGGQPGGQGAQEVDQGEGAAGLPPVDDRLQALGVKRASEIAEPKKRAATKKWEKASRPKKATAGKKPTAEEIGCPTCTAGGHQHNKNCPYKGDKHR